METKNDCLAISVLPESHKSHECRHEGILGVNYWKKSHQWCPSKWVIGLRMKCVSYGV